MKIVFACFEQQSSAKQHPIHDQWQLSDSPIVALFRTASIRREPLFQIGVDELQITLFSSEPASQQILLFDGKGQNVFSNFYLLQEGMNTITVHLDIPAGIYVLKVGNHVQKIVKL